MTSVADWVPIWIVKEKYVFVTFVETFSLLYVQLYFIPKRSNLIKHSIVNTIGTCYYITQKTASVFPDGNMAVWVGPNKP